LYDIFIKKLKEFFEEFFNNIPKISKEYFSKNSHKNKQAGVVHVCTHISLLVLEPRNFL
jgi:hypothetical protein